MFKPSLGTFLLIPVVALLMQVTPAQSNTHKYDDVAQIDVLPGWRTPEGTQMAAIRVRMVPGWKTYWRAPGDAGIPPRFDWERSKNLRSVRLYWPTPTVFDQNGYRSVGYKGDVIIPLELFPKDPDAQVIVLRGRMDLGVCNDVCIPMSVKLNADIPVSYRKDPAIVKSLGNQPSTAKSAKVRSVTCEIEPISDGLRVTAKIQVPRQGNEEAAVFELADQAVWVSQADVTRTGSVLSAASDLVPPTAAPFFLNRSDIRITVIGTNGAVDIRGCTAG